ncbi:MAG: WecB/TagA/CpsF family glycosyltransferase [Actinobacteria bacterium]|jgi:N-acetylglucosaminyldiphosphoundecaprenol N-acetyl-beta-D-mannosaminyltransferase|uniref:Unannotated protein n=1 Tax=freshwater metagenome TaxID=449393 RepID=A0A6J7KM64_9ZZZZ|nr:WecB/TagA/CpsF family glycosyltransferase [Actinomycetota bacterium]MSW79160.1 WecB/TagA/CpsF family glycosyltransferase [Actinomycetota bacterium]MSX54416.1 WecB/TagA/CpsF family glycosyltransferase [Actinomycetota bacterium]MSX94693.1 WecB/TagA/CpsF family glycosyltransferase [Actinomycetota bacterium]MSZ84611.1 WecB/TagA/CpsF family glycosyltransferase [Actinomycetota bacterium]
MQHHRRVDVLGVHISAVDPQSAVDTITDWVQTRQREYVCVTGVHGVNECQHDAELTRIHNQSGLTTPDGMPMVWCSKLAGARSTRRVYGPDLMHDVLAVAARQGWTSYLYGSSDVVLAELQHRLENQHPGLRIVGSCSPPFRELNDHEQRDIVAQINAVDPDLVWVGLSTPKQERWMAAMRPQLQARVLLGVGAAFDFHSGNKRQAPRWMQRTGLEWLFRLMCEPRRLWKRYLLGNTRFIAAIVRRRPRLVERAPS